MRGKTIFCHPSLYPFNITFSRSAHLLCSPTREKRGEKGKLPIITDRRSTTVAIGHQPPPSSPDHRSQHLPTKGRREKKEREKVRLENTFSTDNIPSSNLASSSPSTGNSNMPAQTTCTGQAHSRCCVCRMFSSRE